MKVVLNRTEQVADNIKIFWFKSDRPTRYTAGQFIEFRLPHANPDKRGDKRWFTLSSSPSEDMLAITTKFAPENGSSFKQALAKLKTGDVVQFSEPMGDFVLPKDSSIPLVFVAGGIGVTPMRSMVKYLIDSHEERSVSVLYAARHESEVAFAGLFKNYAAKFTPIISDPRTGWKGQTGKINAEKIISLVPSTKDSRIYLSGPEPMTEALYKDLQDRGISKRQILTDYFPGYVE